MTEKLSPWTKDLTGVNVGHLRVVEFAGYSNQPFRKALWLCRCNCGNTRIVRATRIIREDISFCVRCAHEDATRRGKSTRRLLTDEQRAINEIASAYRQNAARKNLQFLLTDEQIAITVNAPCSYCGVPADHHLNGIDRVDNSLGYIDGNTVTCCATCNYGKRNMTVQQFTDWIERVHAHIHRD